MIKIIKSRRRAMGRIEFLPVCSACGQILHGVRVSFVQPELAYFDNEPCELPPVLSPDRCPLCGAELTAFVMPTRLPFEESMFPPEKKKSGED